MSPEARERSFDDLARGLASGNVTRGKALRLMGAALVGSALTSLGMGGVAAADDSGVDCKRNGKKCKKNSQCCSGICTSSGTCESCNLGTPCGPGGIGNCRANASGAGTTCSCGGETCTNNCGDCSGTFQPICVQAAGRCGPYLQFACTNVCPTCLPNCDASFALCTSNEACCSNICENGVCVPSAGFICPP
jgi:hypothetical protein